MVDIDNYCDNKDVIKIIAGNKCDLDERRIRLDGTQDLGDAYFEISAFDDQRSTINDLFNEISMSLVSG